MDVFCPACHQPTRLEVGECQPSRCSTCLTPLLLGSRFALTSPPPAGPGMDEVVDGVAPVRMGWDLANKQTVCIRLATPDGFDRLVREATVLRGLRLQNVPRVLALVDVEGVGRALVLSAPPGPCLEEQLACGLRTDGRGARALLESLLVALVELERLSPPVLHRNLHSGTVSWDGWGRVSIWDFARATDVVADQVTDKVVGRPGFQPRKQRCRHPEAAELYAVGAILVHVLSRRPPAELERADGTLDFKPAVHVDEELVAFISRLLDAGGRHGFKNAADALQTLRLLELGPAEASSRLAAWGMAGAVMAILLSTGVAFLAFATMPTPNAVSSSVRGVTPARPQPVTLSVHSDPPGAMIFLDGRNLGPAPLTERVGPRLHARVEASLPNHATIVQHVALDQDTVMRLSLPPQPPPLRLEVPMTSGLEDNRRDARDRVLRELAQDITARRAQLVACQQPGALHHRLRVDVDGTGVVQRVAVPPRTPARATRCLQHALSGTRLRAPENGASLSASVRISYAPSFWVMAF